MSESRCTLPPVGTIVLYAVLVDVEHFERPPLPAIVLEHEHDIEAARLRVFSPGGDFTALALSGLQEETAARLPLQGGQRFFPKMPGGLDGLHVSLFRALKVPRETREPAKPDDDKAPESGAPQAEEAVLEEGTGTVPAAAPPGGVEPGEGVPDAGDAGQDKPADVSADSAPASPADIPADSVALPQAMDGQTDGQTDGQAEPDAEAGVPGDAHDVGRTAEESDGQEHPEEEPPGEGAASDVTPEAAAAAAPPASAERKRRKRSTDGEPTAGG